MPGVRTATRGLPSHPGGQATPGSGAGGRIVFDGADAVLVKQFREHLHHRLAVFQHVADTGRGAGIVFQNVELVFAGAHDVGSDNMGIDATRRP